jgi:hypothetical protein
VKSLEQFKRQAQETWRKVKTETTRRLLPNRVAESQIPTGGVGETVLFYAPPIAPLSASHSESQFSLQASRVAEYQAYVNQYADQAVDARQSGASFKDLTNIPYTREHWLSTQQRLQVEQQVRDKLFGGRREQTLGEQVRLWNEVLPRLDVWMDSQDSGRQLPDHMNPTTE